MPAYQRAATDNSATGRPRREANIFTRCSPEFLVHVAELALQGMLDDCAVAEVGTGRNAISKRSKQRRLVVERSGTKK